MRCSRVDKLLEPWAAGGLAASSSQVIEKHLESCPACRRQAGVLSRIDSALVAGENAEVDPRALSRLLITVKAEAAQLKTRSVQAMGRRNRRAWEAIAAIMALLALAELTGTVDVSGRAALLVRTASSPVVAMSLRLAGLLRDRLPVLSSAPDWVAGSISIALLAVAALTAVFAFVDYLLAEEARRRISVLAVRRGA